MKALMLLQGTLTEHFSDDVSQPGITVSWIPKLNKWYVSACRYRLALGRGKEVLAKAKHEHLVDAIDECHRRLIAELQSRGVYEAEHASGQ